MRTSCFCLLVAGCALVISSSLVMMPMISAERSSMLVGLVSNINDFK